MGILSFLNKKKILDLETPDDLTAKSEMVFVNSRQFSHNPIFEDTWDGEKTPGELGAVYDTLPDHLRLRLRAYDMDLKTDIIKIITGKFFKWVIGSGLKLQSEPDKTVLEMFGITEDLSVFVKQSEALFNLYINSKYSDYHKNDTLHDKASEAFKASFLGGDCLCIIRFDEFGPNIQVVDGNHIESPLDETEKQKGNIIKNGIEINPKGEHVAFYVKSINSSGDVIDFKYKRIKAKNKNGGLVAWMIYGDKARIDHVRGIPKISSILEKVSKLDRYVEASVTKAEQTANVVYAFKHSDKSTGENIMLQSLSSKKTNDQTDDSTYEKNGRTANMLRQSTSGTVMNLAPESDLISLSSPSENNFNEFFRAIFVSICASVDIPEEVALQKYEQNYSSSRAAINGWEHIVEVYRQKFSKKFYEPFYRAWLENQILSGTIKAPGFLKAKKDDNFMVMEAYFKSRFTGKKMPHIDPLKEAKAIRLMLGDDATALISFEQATEALGAGEWSSNYEKLIEERKIIEDDPNQNNE